MSRGPCSGSSRAPSIQVPPGVHSYAILPIGFPMGRFGPVGRGTLADIVYQDKWGKPYAVLN